VFLQNYESKTKKKNHTASFFSTLSILTPQVRVVTLLPPPPSSLSSSSSSSSSFNMELAYANYTYTSYVNKNTRNAVADPGGPVGLPLFWQNQCNFFTLYTMSEKIIFET